MRKRIFVLVLFLVISNQLSVISVGAEINCEDTSKYGSYGFDELKSCQGQLEKTAQAISSANATNAQELSNLNTQIIRLKTQISGLDTQLDKLTKDVFDREVKIGVRQQLLSAKIREDYIRKKSQSSLLLLFASGSADKFFRDLAYRRYLAQLDRATIATISGEIKSLSDQSTVISNQKKSLDGLRQKVDSQATWLAGEVKKASAYVSDLSGKVAALSAKQNEILAARSGNFTASIGDSELSDDYNSSIKGFRESAPSGSFAVFSFGAYTHRKGMSQYGAKGRAQNGQNYNDILKAYYGSTPVNKDTGGNISVSGHGSINFEDFYLMGIAEMPSSFPTEALKAQAVAARTYAYRYKTSGQSICTNEACQVFSKSKASNPPEAWKQAVQSTRGQVLDNIVTYYSSTTGGYIPSMGWDTTDGGGGPNFFDKTYEKIGASPWAYKAWYRSGYSPSGDSCSRGNPWLSSEDMADLINAALYRDDRVTPVTTSCWGGNPYSYSELQAKANGPASVSSVRVTQGNGNTNEVVFQTDKGEIRISGSDFKTAFNLRAPGRLRIPQSGFAFFNIEKK